MHPPDPYVEGGCSGTVPGFWLSLGFWSVLDVRCLSSSCDTTSHSESQAGMRRTSSWRDDLFPYHPMGLRSSIPHHSPDMGTFTRLGRMGPTSVGSPPTQSMKGILPTHRMAGV